jgi:hypothetical protein
MLAPRKSHCIRIRDYLVNVDVDDTPVAREDIFRLRMHILTSRSTMLLRSLCLHQNSIGIHLVLST